MRKDMNKERSQLVTKLSYSKSTDFYLDTKKEFFNENEKLLKKALEQNNLFSKQPVRVFCKICASKLPNIVDFHSHGIDYVFCKQCSHLNGKFEDTQEYIENLYISEDGSDYSKNYLDNNFSKRSLDVYIPKIDFLINNIPPKKYEILDVGCGSGYFVYSALLRNLSASGLDVSKTMVDFGNHQISHHLGVSPLSFVHESSFYDAVIDSSADVVSAIGVIEHLREPHKLFDAFKKCKAQYLYYSVPMFSFSVVLENIFKGVFPRQLSGGHTHLFTEQSIQKMNEIIGVKSIAEWRFGTDIMDLYRHSLISLKKNTASPKLLAYLDVGFGKIIDEMQAKLDRNHFCSEIHCIVSKA